MFTRIFVPTLACAVLAFPLARSADEKQTPEQLSEMRVRLRLNAIETSKLEEHYETLVKRELSLQDNVRACLKSGDQRLPEYQQALQDAQADLEKTKTKLVARELEKAKLSERLGKRQPQDASLEAIEKSNRTLEKILERLGSIEKRLEKVQR